MSTVDLQYDEEDVLDLDASRRESGHKPIPVRLGGHTFLLPPQLPASILDPLFEGELDDIIAALVDLVENADADDADKTDLSAFFARVREHPSVIPGALKAIHQVFRNLIGEEQWPQWIAKNPGFGDYWAVAKHAWRRYGVGLGEALGFASSSKGGGDSSSKTSRHVASTRARSGSRARTRA